MPPSNPDQDVQSTDRIKGLRGVEATLRIQRLIVDHFPGVDLEAAAVFLTVVASNLAPAARSGEALQMMEVKPLPADWLRPISGRAVAASCGLPRETVRRRLESLERLGEIERVPGGYRMTGDLFARNQNLSFARSLVHEFETASRAFEQIDQARDDDPTSAPDLANRQGSYRTPANPRRGRRTNSIDSDYDR